MESERSIQFVQCIPKSHPHYHSEAASLAVHENLASGLGEAWMTALTMDRTIGYVDGQIELACGQLEDLFCETAWRRSR